MSLSDQISKQLKNMNVSTVRLKNGLTCKEILRHEADRLKSCIQKRINEFYGNHSTSGQYDRTDAFRQSLMVDDILEIDVVGNQLRIYLLFDDGLAYHPSLWGGEKGFVPSLIEFGWSWNQDNIHRRYLSYFEGFDYVGLGIQDYNQDNPYGIKVNIIKNR